MGGPDLKTKIIIFFLLLIPLITLAVYANMPEKRPHPQLLSDQTELQPPIAEAAETPEIDTNTSTENLIPFPAKGIPVLMYHSISTRPGNTLCVPETQFQEEVAWLYNNNYHTLSMEQLSQALVNGTKVPENPIVITFDDGYADNYQAAWPVLKQYGFTATFFIVTKNIGLTNSMTWDQLKELADQGNTIGSHTVHHLDMTKLSNALQRSEIQDSKQILEEHLGISVTAFCFPSGQYWDTTLNYLSDAGYQLGFTTRPGRVYHGNNQYKLHRVRIDGDMPLSGFIYQVSY